MAEFYFIADTNSFQGTCGIFLQPGDVLVPYQFKFSVCTSSTGNDGAIPYGVTVSSVTATAHREDGVNVSTGIIAVSSWSSTSAIETLYLGYPTSSGALAGKYHLTFSLAATSTAGFYKDIDFNRVIVRDN